MGFLYFHSVLFCSVSVLIFCNFVIILEINLIIFSKFKKQTFSMQFSWSVLASLWKVSMKFRWPDEKYTLVGDVCCCSWEELRGRRRTQSAEGNTHWTKCLQTYLVLLHQYLPYARHYNPRFVYFLPHFSVRFITKSG